MPSRGYSRFSQHHAPGVGGFLLYYIGCCSDAACIIGCIGCTGHIIDLFSYHALYYGLWRR